MSIAPCELTGFWINLTGPESLIKANAPMMEYQEDRRRKREDGDMLRLGYTSARVRRPCAFGEGCRIARSTVGPNVSIGKQVTIGDGCWVENAIIMDRASLEEGVFVRFAVVRPGAVIRTGEQITGDPDRVAVVG